MYIKKNSVSKLLTTNFFAKLSQLKPRYTRRFQIIFKYVLISQRYSWLNYKDLYGSAVSRITRSPSLLLYSQTKGVKRRISTVYSTLNIWKTTKTMYTCNHSQESSNVCDNFTLPVFSTLGLVSVSY